MNRPHRPAKVLLALAAAALALTPATAEGAQPNIGGGTFTGSIAFSGIGIPPVNTPCRTASFTFTAVAAMTLVNGAGSQGAWTNAQPIGGPLTGTGSSTCENAVVGGGLLTLHPMSMTNPVTQTKLSCTSLTGNYTRTGTDLAAVLSGTCAIDSFDAGTVTTYMRAQTAPAPGTGNGLTTNITTASAAGTFLIVPA